MTESRSTLHIDSDTVEATEAFAGALAKSISNTEQGFTVHLIGELGAGKTTFSRGFIRGLGFSGSVKSPTYTLVEPYEIDSLKLFHFDLYRLSDPEELEFLGFRDYQQSNCISLIEWPSRGEGLLSVPDMKISIEFIEPGRNIKVEALSDIARACLSSLSEKAD